MSRSVLGVILAALLIGGLFAASHYMPPAQLSILPADQAASVSPGFIGSKSIGPWTLGCDTAQVHAKANADDRMFGRCRLVLIYHRRQNPAQVVLILNFRALAKGGNLSLITAIPAVAKKGDALDLLWGKKGLKMGISFCREKADCIAVIAMTPKVEAEFLASPNAVLALPPGPDGKRTGIPVPMTGLRDAVAAMRRAQT